MATFEPRLPFYENDQFGQSTSPPVDQSASRPVGRSRPVDQSASQPVDQSASQPVDQSASQPVDQSAGRPVRDLPDAAARTFAVDPAENVLLEASAGTGKTRVLVDRYVNLLRAGVEPRHILAITFTRKAAAEMRQRILDRLKGEPRWAELRDHLADISVSTIDAFCLGLLREFPLEADVDPAFELADETEIPRLLEESLDRTLRICRSLAADDDDVALVFAQLGERRLRAGLAALVDRRLVAPNLLRRYLSQGPRELTPAAACRTAARRLADLFAAIPGGPAMFERTGPVGRVQFALLARDVAALPAGDSTCTFDTRSEQAAFRVLIDRLRAYFLTQTGEPRGDRFAGTGFKASDCESEAAWKRHRSIASALAPEVAAVIAAFRRDLNVVLSRGVRRMFQIAVSQYERALERRALLDFAGVLDRALNLLKLMDEFARSRFRLEARYHHVLLDEFQDTNRAQWELVQQLVRTWGEGMGAAGDGGLLPSIFIVGDRKQSIYGFRDADVTLLDEATRMIAGLRGTDARRAISVSFRAVPPLLAFVNDVFAAVQSERPAASGRADSFRFEEDDRFPPTDIDVEREIGPVEPAVGLIAGPTVRAAAESVAGEIVRLIDGAIVRDRSSGIRRRARPSDIAILFRSRESHREFEAALERRGVSTYVYKGLGFFDADEIQDAVAALRYLADPTSNLRAAAFLRSRTVRISDRALLALAPNLAAALVDGDADRSERETGGLERESPAREPSTVGREPSRSESLERQPFRRAIAPLDANDADALTRARAAVARWLPLVDRITPVELLDHVLAESAYYVEIRGSRRLQARENLKKLRALVRRIQNRGYATLARIADHLEQLAVGDESNAAVDAVDAVALMTIHAAKGLEFPIVFVVNVNRGTGGMKSPIRITTSSAGTASVSVADFQSEADEEAQARDREDSKRLLYVALTRARDRLYLSATVDDAACRMGRGSLGDVLPAAFANLFACASGQTAGTITWSAPTGGQHEFAVCRHDGGGDERVRDTLDREPVPGRT